MNLLIVDLEATCWEKDTTFKKQSEIIEIGACIINDNMDILSEFQSFVKPVQNIWLSDFCIHLTTIVQDDVDKAREFPEVLKEFIDWFSPYKISTWGSWGLYDRNQILLDCNYWGILFPLKSHINIKNKVASFLNSKPRGVGNALKNLKLEFEGIQHRALNDVKNIIKIMKTSKLKLCEEE